MSESSVILVNQTSFSSIILDHKGLTLLVCLFMDNQESCTAVNMVNTINKKYRAEIQCCQMEMNDNELFSQTLEINENPTYFLIRDGQIIDEIAGVLALVDLEDFLEINM